MWIDVNKQKPDCDKLGNGWECDVLVKYTSGEEGICLYVSRDAPGPLSGFFSGKKRVTHWKPR